MHVYRQQHRSHHSAEDMFNLVADVENYPLFLPLCESMTIRHRRSPAGEGHGRETIIATMGIAYKFLHESFTTKVELDRNAHHIRVEYIDGPLRHLENGWRFTALPDETCQINFCIAYEFHSRMLQALMGQVFDRAVRKFVTAFEARADLIYGRPAARKTPAPL